MFKCFKVILCEIRSFSFDKISVHGWLDDISVLRGIRRHSADVKFSQVLRGQIFLSVQLPDRNWVSCLCGCFQSIILVLSMLRGQFETWYVADGELSCLKKRVVGGVQTAISGTSLKFAKKRAEYSRKVWIASHSSAFVARQQISLLRLYNHTISSILHTCNTKHPNSTRSWFSSS